jgi:predicted metallo-beta-lactamase superfamily hydrolase
VKSLSKKAKSKGDRSQYFADYYEKNKDVILAKRKENYKKKKREM